MTQANIVEHLGAEYFSDPYSVHEIDGASIGDPSTLIHGLETLPVRLRP